MIKKVVHESRPWQLSMKVIHESCPWHSSMKVIHDSPWQPDRDCKPFSACFWKLPLRTGMLLLELNVPTMNDFLSMEGTLVRILNIFLLLPCIHDWSFSAGYHFLITFVSNDYHFQIWKQKLTFNIPRNCKYFLQNYLLWAWDKHTETSFYEPKGQNTPC